MSASYSPVALTSSTSGLREYVTELQLHMALQARSLTPSLSLSPEPDSPLVMLQQAQADMEKTASRQWL
ncbi:hypothetical protein [Thermostichus vulcanus]|uniref:Uncharacterized protein n=1 Tax=Thermostichus vulcanus str. 'Rupite' TaxID=2813851 RepID=A0ABT0CCK3_THEVL|nr:hypothetical protein [Thermostichus vulcanus]MCJ2543493.1 hypothetical protein [Thermostichus vulcanus str. 'Rupite']